MKWEDKKQREIVPKHTHQFQFDFHTISDYGANLSPFDTFQLYVRYLVSQKSDMTDLCTYLHELMMIVEQQRIFLDQLRY